MANIFRFELDAENKILLMRFEQQRLTDELLAEVYAAIRQYSMTTGAYAGIWDFSFVTQVDVSGAFVRQLASQEPAMPGATARARVVVFTADAGYSLAREFQIVGELTRPMLLVVRTLDEALEALGVEDAHFEPLSDVPPPAR